MSDTTGGAPAASSVHLVLLPGEEIDTETNAARGHICVLVDGNAVAFYKACAGPPEGFGDRGHTAVPTPAGEYVLGDRQSHVTMSWPSSAIPWAALLRERADGVIEYSTNATDWMPATGPSGVVTKAMIAWQARQKASGGQAAPSNVDPSAEARNIVTGGSSEVPQYYTGNDFGPFAWNLLRGGQATPYFVHTTPSDEKATASGGCDDVELVNSHGCVHIRPVDRDEMVRRGFLQKGVRFTVKPYGAKDAS
jgi:hypothetical protein